MTSAGRKPKSLVVSLRPLLVSGHSATADADSSIRLVPEDRWSRWVSLADVFSRRRAIARHRFAMRVLTVVSFMVLME